MKQLEIKTNKRLLIVEDYITGNLDNYYEKYRKENPGKYLKFICKGSELTEDIANGLVHQSLHTKLFAHYVKDIPVNVYCYINSLDSFETAINAYGYHWGENPVKEPTKENYGYGENINVLDYPPEWDEECYHEDMDKWKESESRTFNPSKCIIFEIV